MPEQQKPQPQHQPRPEQKPDAQTRYAGVGPPGWVPIPGPWLYLMDKGWKPYGMPDSKHTRWRNPKKPIKGSQEKVPVIAPHLEVREDKDGKPRNVWVDKPVQWKDRHGQSVPVQQVRITPPGRLYTLDDALATQAEYDEQEAEEATQRELAASVA